MSEGLSSETQRLRVGSLHLVEVMVKEVQGACPGTVEEVYSWFGDIVEETVVMSLSHVQVCPSPMSDDQS